MHSSIILSIFGLVASTSAHMKMSEPKGWFVNNSPLDPSGSDFPCKAVNYGGQSEMNTYSQGQSAPLTFIGQAVHGGGSCQVVLTTDTAPTKSSVWKVIKSIEGGCPAQGEAGNMGDSAEAEDPYKYEFVIPKQIPAGKYTIAWTWFNKIGNREMYMNCGPATITGDGGDESYFNSLPDMFTANIGEDCKTPPSTDLEFPNPGEFVERLNGATSAFAAPVGTACAAGGGGGAPPAAAPTGDASGSRDGRGGAAAPAPTSAPESAPANDGSDGSDALPGGVFVTVDGGAADAASTPVPAATPAATLPDPNSPVGVDGSGSGSGSESGTDSVESGSSDSTPAPAPASPPAGSSGSAGGAAFAAGTACSQEGYWNCVGGTSFQRCASGQWSSIMALAAGTSCSGGLAENIALSRRGQAVSVPRLSAKLRV